MRRVGGGGRGGQGCSEKRFVISRDQQRRMGLRERETERERERVEE